MRHGLTLAGVALVLALVPAVCRAELTRVEVTSRADVASGRSFGAVGPYELIAGKAYFTADPRNPHNAHITDIGKAAGARTGTVPFSADFIVIRPKEPSRGNGVLLLEILNRGSWLMLRSLNHTPRGGGGIDGQGGDGFLFDHGYTLAWVGWQGDLPEGTTMLRADLPRALGIVGQVRTDFTQPDDAADAPLPTGEFYPPLAASDARNRLTVREDPYTGGTAVKAWRFSADRRRIVVDGGLKAGRVYEVIYRAKDPYVAGLGFAAVRDFAAAMRQREVAGIRVRHAIAFGESQSGRMLREFLYQGFNAAEDGSRVFDGVMAHIAGAARGSFTFRFAASGGDTYYYPSRFPFTADPQTDPVTGARGGLLDRAKADGVAPRVFFTNSAVEYWGGRGASLIHTTLDGLADVPQPDNVRIYFFSGQQHGPAAFPPAVGGAERTRQLPNPLDAASWVLRALLVKMTAWVETGASPPPSRYPRVADGTLVAVTALKFPSGIGQTPTRIPGNFRLGLGPRFERRGIPSWPARFGAAYTVMVPQVDADGNELAGVRMPELVVPLATYTGWNFRTSSAGSPQSFVRLIGSYVPFALTRSEREAGGDSRVSVEERYGTRDAYLQQVRAAARALATDGFLVETDVDALVAGADRHWQWRHDGRPAPAGRKE